MTVIRRAAILPLAAASLTALCGSASVAAPIVYSVQQQIGAGSVTGTITTDGALGTLAASDITAYNLALSAPNADYFLTNSNSSVLAAGFSDVSADSQNIYFNYGAADGGGMGIQANNYTYSGQHYWCNAAAGNFACFSPGASVVPASYSDRSAQYEHRTGIQAIASVGGAISFVVPPTVVQVTDGLYTDGLQYQVAVPPHPGTPGPGGLYHYSYDFTYTGQATLVIPLFNAGDVSSLSGDSCAVTGYTSISNNLQQDFGTAYHSAISCMLPGGTTARTAEIGFNSIYTPTEVTIALVDQAGVIHLIDPPIPNNPTQAGGTPVPEPASAGLLVAALLGLAGVRRARSG